MSRPRPARGLPERTVLQGRYVRLEPIGAVHVPTLFAAASAPGAAERFRYLPERAPENQRELAVWVERAAAQGDPLMFAVVDTASGRCGGRQALMRIVPEHGVIEIGSIYWGPDIARTRLATEALYLFARYVFDTLGYRRFEWKCNNRNEPSKRAAQRFGFQFEGVFRQHMIQKGENRDTAWFSMLDGEWQRLRPEYERWLGPGNFDAAGTQKTPLRFG
ncbi:MAG TPA: GNAT family N-acetyltransferase [Alphaproteobacteria bacterium]|nr:GNAT family N-acetyltransferase [Alphaproteobacteria bacterium]